MKNTRIKRFLSMLMCMVMAVTSPCTSVFAYTDSYIEEIFEQDSPEEFVSLADLETVEEDLFTGYMLGEAEDMIAGREDNGIHEEAGLVTVECGSLLGGIDRYCYEELKKKCKAVAAGRLSNTVFYVPISDEMNKEYTAEMLGVSSLYENGSITAEASAAMKAQLEVSYMSVVRSLMLDMPYDMYWFDKVSGYSLARCYDYKYKNENNVETLSYSATYEYGKPAWRFSLSVAEAYRADSSNKYLFNCDMALKALDAANKAAEDVLEIEGSVSNDYVKLCKYREKIKKYSGYNSTAASTKNYPYGDPWQMIYVFDDDPSTTVVCEGFSKAFKFMCDLSAFAGDIECYLVSGYLNGSGGQHMWNNVRMEDGAVYLVDITNSSSVNRCFLSGAQYNENYTLNVESKADGKYTTKAYISGNRYYYDKLTMSRHNADVLRYTTSDYDPSKAKESVRVTLSMNYAGQKSSLCAYKGEDILVKILNRQPARDGYSFDGWYTEAEGGTALAGLGSLILNDNDHVYYAHWTKMGTTDVTADATEGAFSDGRKEMTVSMYEGLPYYESFEVPVYEHHWFLGWCSDVSCNKIISQNAVYTASDPEKIYAKWQLKRYRLTLYPEGGEFYDGGTKAKAVTYNALSKLGNPSKYDPVKAGYDFAGWFTAAEGGVEYDISQPIKGNFSLYAQYTVHTENEEDKKDEKDKQDEEGQPDESSKEKDPNVNDDSSNSDNKPDTPVKPEDKDIVSVNGFYAVFADDGMYKDDKGIWHAVYSGDKLTPAVRVYDNRHLLTEGVDYSISYVNNLKAYEVSGKTAYVRIKGKGNLKGSYKLNFVIDRLSLQSVSVGNLCVKKGSEQKASPALIHNGRVLKKNKDYTLSINGKNIEINGIGNCVGNINCELKVLSAAEYADKAIKVKLDLPAFVYDGTAKILKDGSELIVTAGNGAAASYKISYSGNINAGKVKIAVCGTGDHHGVITKSFRIKACKVKAADAFDISYANKETYKKGGTKARLISVFCRSTGETLKEGTDFSCIYGNNKKAGTAKLKLKFKGNYKGSACSASEYTIEKRDLAEAQVYVGDVTFTSVKKYSPKVIVTCDGSLVDAKEYKVETPPVSGADGPKENVPVSVVSKEKNYSGSAASVSFNVTTAGIDINGAKVIFKNGAGTQKYEGYGDDVKLVAGKDYVIRVNSDLTLDKAGEIEQEFDIIYTDNKGIGKATMIIVPKTAKYIGLAKASFKIKAADVNELVER